MDQLQQEIQELFSDLWQVPRFSGLRAGFRPHVDCFRTDDALTVLVELPGVDPDKVDLFVAEGTSTSPGTGRGRAARGRCTSRWRSTTAPSAGRCRSAQTSTSHGHARPTRRDAHHRPAVAQRPAAGERVVIAVTRA